jgi:L-aspartate oxidase
LSILPQTSSGIVIVGAGLAGLFTALKLNPLPVIVIAAAPIGKGASSAWAQGGIAAAISEGDTPEKHATDTIDAGAGIVDENIALLMAREAPARIKDLLSYGVPFDRDLEGKLSFSREAAHSHHRIVRVKGDMAGRKIMEALIAAVRQTPSITIIENYAAHELITEKGKVTGLEAHNVSEPEATSSIFIPAWAVVLASGGVGGLYKTTTNPPEARGNGMAIAARAGAIIADAEFVQFHPTGIAVDIDPSPLATEALRGDGSILVNGSGERFMKPVHEDAELAPRDIVARAVFREIEAGREAYLDCRKHPGSEFKTKFPQVYSYCQAAEINPETDLIPIGPTAHYHMGGVLCDASGRSTVNGLWACGEVASTGAHGANRLASNSLLEAAVFAARIAEDIALTAPYRIQPVARDIVPSKPLARARTGTETIRQVRTLMSRYVGVIRNRAGLMTILSELETYRQHLTEPSQISNILVAARIIVVSALERCESRGGHFRDDYPQNNEPMAHRSFFTLEQINELSQEYIENA